MTDRKRALIIGGGVAGLEGALALNALSEGRVSVAIVEPRSEFVARQYSIAEAFHASETRHASMARLASLAGADLVPAGVTAIDPDEHVASTGEGPLPFDLLLVAAGTSTKEAVPHALTFTGPAAEHDLTRLLDSAVQGETTRIVFAVPGGATWLLPLYELALLTSANLADRGTRAEIVLVTPEEHPLGLFGLEARRALSELLDVRGIEVHTGVTPVTFEGGTLHVVPEATLPADAVVALPRLEGTRIEGLRYDSAGFLPTDVHGHVDGPARIYAAGDMTSYPIKHGGLAAQQADAAAESMAADAGASIVPTPFRPVLRGRLMTGIFDRYLVGEPGGTRSLVGTESLWWPSSKVAGRFLGPFLARHIGLQAETPTWAASHGLPVETELHEGAAAIPGPVA